MIRNKSFINFICAISIVTVLLVTITGRTIPVKAVVTTAAIAGTAFVLTGAVYLSYVALTQGEMVLPVAEEMHNWLSSIGRKVSQYPSGASAYQEIYQNLARDPAVNIIDGIWTWTKERIKSFVNDFSDTRIISDILKHYVAVSDDLTPTNGFVYGDVSTPQEVYFNGNYFTFDQFPTNSIVSGERVYSQYYDSFLYTTETRPLRNVLNANGLYSVQVYTSDNVWVNITSLDTGIYVYGERYGVGTNSIHPAYYVRGVSSSVYPLNAISIPCLPNAVIYDAVNDVDLPMVISQTENLPSWVDPDNNNRPIIPWVPIPQLPDNVTPPTGYVNPQWGFNLQDLLDKLEDLAGTLIDIGSIAALINEFAGLHGDEYYIEYNDGDTNYYTYYQPTIFDNDTEYITYNIDVSEQQDTIPVDLNTIQLYTNNDYLSEIKYRSQKFGETLGEYFVFWHNSDPMTVYVIFGSVIVILIGAFIGKWGHS